MKQRFFSTLLFSVLFLFALNLQGDISYTSKPSVSCWPSSFTKYVDIVTGESTWYYDWVSGTATVSVSAGMSGVGQGQGTLTNISIMGKPPIGTWQDKESDAGTANPDGSWSSGTGSASASYSESIPDTAEDGDSWSWSAGGSTTIWPWEWHETTAWGVNVSVPAGVSGRYTTTGGWQKGTTVSRSAPGRSGSITLDIDYKCTACNRYGDTPEAIGGKAAHEEIPCPRDGCSVRYRKCSPPTGHEVCDGCGDRKCDGDDHSYVDKCNLSGLGCGKDIYKCTESDHGAVILDCGDAVLACMRDSHTCVTDETPNCQDCTSHCSSPCSCTNSGTCNGTVVDETPNCQDCTSHCSSPCSCTNSGTCNGTVSTPPSGSTPPEDDDGDSGDSGDSSSNMITCSANSSHSYPANHPNVGYLNDLHRSRTCRFSGCGNSWHACSIEGWSPYCNNPYRKRNGWKCGE